MISQHPLGFKYTTTPDPYETDIDTASGVSYLRYSDGDDRCWIYRITKTVLSATRTLTTVEKTYGQWVSRQYHTYYPIHQEIESVAFALINFDTFVLSILTGTDATFNGTYYPIGRRTFDSEHDVYSELGVGDYPIYVHEDFNAEGEAAVKGIVVFDIATNTWIVRDSDPDGVEYLHETLYTIAPPPTAYLLE